MVTFLKSSKPVVAAVLLLAYAGIASGDHVDDCVPIPGFEDYAYFCELPQCLEWYSMWCRLNPEIEKQPRCNVRGGGDAALHPECSEVHCERKTPEFCELRDDLKTPFEKSVSISDVVKSVPWPISDYEGLSGWNAATKIYWDIVDAILMPRTDTGRYPNMAVNRIEFCGTGNIEADRREFAAFMASVVEDTDVFRLEEEQDPQNTYCEWHNQDRKVTDASCCSGPGNDMHCIGGLQGGCDRACDFRGRGMLHVKGSNFTFELGAWFYEDYVLFQKNPERILTDGLKWAAALFVWMDKYNYLQQCPPFEDPGPGYYNERTYKTSPHLAMHQEARGGFGQTLRLLDADYRFLSCEISKNGDKATRRWEYFLNAATAMGVSPHPNCAVGQEDCDLSGMEHFDATDGKVGNPLLGGKFDPLTCPDCGQPKCEAVTIPVQICAGRPEWVGDQCPTDLKYKVFMCEKYSRYNADGSLKPQWWLDASYMY